MKMMNKTMIILPVLIMVSLVYCSSAYAWFWDGARHRRDRGYPHHDRYPSGKLAVALPHGFIEIGFGGQRYFYNSGIFYTPSAREYIVVPPPTGIVVYELPAGWHTVIIDGVTYYTFQGVYYTRIPRGYQVVQPPRPVVVEPVTVSASVAADQAQQEFTVNIPDSKGGYVPVVIKKTANGFVGPQGEFYSEFPKVAQLQVMYGK